MTTAEDPGPVLATKDLEVRYGAALALHGVSLEVPRGAVLTLLGVNGAGKSSFARTISGLVPASGGKIFFEGADVTSWSPEKIRRAGMIHLPEGRGIFPNLSVLENLRLAVKLLPRSARQDAIEKGYSLFPILGKRRTQRGGTLSGGEQQMLSMARAFIVDPKIVVVDEPSLGLAPILVDMVFESLSKAKGLGITMVLIEQFAERALKLSDQCAILRRGEVVWAGPADEANEYVAEEYLGVETGQTDGSDAASGIAVVNGKH